MEPEEIEFIAEDSMIQIIPKFNCTVMHLIAGDTGPFRGGIPCNVPLWLGLDLKKQHKCTIVPPDWMDVQELEDLLQAEKLSKNFIKMPSEHYMVEAKLLLAWASDDIKRYDEVRTLIKDIWDVRMSKIRTSTDALIREGASHAVLTNLTMMEINTVRPLLPHCLNQLHRIRTEDAEDNLSLTTQRTQNDTLSFLNTSSRD